MPPPPLGVSSVLSTSPPSAPSRVCSRREGGWVLEAVRHDALHTALQRRTASGEWRRRRRGSPSVLGCAVGREPRPSRWVHADQVDGARWRWRGGIASGWPPGACRPRRGEGCWVPRRRSVGGAWRGGAVRWRIQALEAYVQRACTQAVQDWGWRSRWQAEGRAMGAVALGSWFGCWHAHWRGWAEREGAIGASTWRRVAGARCVARLHPAVWLTPPPPVAHPPTPTPHSTPTPPNRPPSTPQTRLLSPYSRDAAARGRPPGGGDAGAPLGPVPW